MSELLFTINAIMPILLPILLGYFLKRINFFSKDFLKETNKLVFKILIPVLLFSNLYNASLENFDGMFVLFAALSVTILFFLGYIFVKIFIKDDKQKGVVQQAFFRSNYAVIGIPLAQMLVGDSAVAMASVIAAVSVPLFNIYAVIALSIYDKESGNKIDVKSILKKIVTNPLIIGVFCGIVFIGIRMLLELCGVTFVIDAQNQFLPKTIKSIASLATPLALIVLGGQFEFKAVKKLLPQILSATIASLLVAPVLMMTLGYFLGFSSPIHFSVMIALFATPIAVSSAPMAAQMGQDEELAGQLVVWGSALSAISLFLIIMVCSLIGIF